MCDMFEIHACGEFVHMCVGFMQVITRFVKGVTYAV